MERRLKQDPAGTRPPPPLHPPTRQQPPVKREPRDDGRPMGYHNGEDPELDYGNEGPRREPLTKQLNISNSYVPTWGCSEAFRESYQNWRDGIIASFDLEWSQFQAKCTESNRVILISATHPKTQDLLGFIRFEYDQNGLSVDGLKMVNFSATLEYQMLGIGTTTKAKNSNQAGQHGEGLKLSALVFRRNNYNFCIESGEQSWNFIFEKGELTCKIHEMRDKNLTVLRDIEKGKPRTFIFRPWEDVCVTVGASGLSRTIDNKFVTGNRVSVDQVRKWLKITLDVNPPKEIIRTVKGDIIRNPEYRGQMYLRGLLLPNGGVTQQPYAYGYNFHEGHTSRDRSSLSSSGEETNRITAIWEAAMRADNSPRSEVVAEYAHLLQNSINKMSDVMLGTGRCLSKDNTKRIWKIMLASVEARPGKPGFYYNAVDNRNEIHIIEQSLNKTPIPLDKELWRIMKHYNLCRKPSEELTFQFTFANAVPIPDTIFAQHVTRMLKCLLHATLKSSDLIFVDGRESTIDVHFDGSIWRIHKRWLTSGGAHKLSPCEEEHKNNDDMFSCDHVIYHLWDLMVAYHGALGLHSRTDSTDSSLKNMARLRLSQTPRAVTCQPNDKRGQLHVTWSSVDSYQHRDKRVKIGLHDQSCAQFRAALRGRTGSQTTKQPLLHPLDILLNMGEVDVLCSCRISHSQAVSDGVTFTGLDPTRNYYANVSRDIESAFIALPPKPIKPRSVDSQIHPQSVTTVSVKTEALQTQAAPEIIVLSDDEEIATPTERSHTRSGSARSFMLGDRVAHNNLDWSGGFPGSYDFYRVRDTPSENVFIAMPRSQSSNKSVKRELEDNDGGPRSKARKT